MLVLTRKVGERILIGDDITIELVEIRKAGKAATVRLGITAPKEIRVDREEVRAKRTEPNAA